jgi:predicted CoA-substrate-specific enzyme activase
MKVNSGIDIGTVYTKCVIYDENKNLLIKKRIHTDDTLKSITEKILLSVLRDLNMTVEDINKISITGQDRRSIKDLFSKKIVHYPEVIAISKAISTIYLEDEPKLILDIGGERWKFIYSDNKGKVLDFLLNDRCAAGTGKLLDYLVEILEMTIEEFTESALKSKDPVQISQTCGVFLESEIISKLSEGVNPDDLFAGVFQNICKNIYNRSSSINNKEKILYLTGGLSNNTCLRKVFGVSYDEIRVPEHSDYIGAIGSALFLYT